MVLICNEDVNIKFDFEVLHEEAMRQLQRFEGADELRIAWDDCVLTIEGICPEYWEDDISGLWYAILSCQCVMGTRAFLINKNTAEVKGTKRTGFIRGFRDTLEKYDCIVSFEDSRTVCWTRGQQI